MIKRIFHPVAIVVLVLCHRTSSFSQTVIQKQITRKKTYHSYSFNSCFKKKTERFQEIQSRLSEHKNTFRLKFSVIEPQVVKVSATAIFELLTACGLGYYASVKGVLDQPTRSALSKCTYGIFLPALLLANVASTVAAQSLLSLLALPIIAVVQIVTCMLFSNVMMKVMNIERYSDKGRIFQICATFGNAGILPLVFVNALFRSHPDPTLLPKAISYVSFFQMGWSPLFWGWGYSVLQGPQKLSEVRKRLRRNMKIDNLKKKLTRSLKMVLTLREALNSPLIVRVLSPPILACFLGVLFGGVPPLRDLMVRPSAPLSPVFTALRTLGAAYTPAGLLVLAGSLSGTSTENQPKKDLYKLLGGVSFSRFVIAPLVAVGLIRLLEWIKIMPADPVMVFVILLQSCMPSAQNSVVILQVEQKQEAAKLMAQMLCLLYILALLPTSGMITLFLQITGLAQH